ncbi:MAG: hypothetical protein Q7S02_04480, partial [bacterium]|nr:hypothetical protein [bacterium]
RTASRQFRFMIHPSEATAIRRLAAASPFTATERDAVLGQELSELLRNTGYLTDGGIYGYRFAQTEFRLAPHGVPCNDRDRWTELAETDWSTTPLLQYLDDLYDIELHGVAA